ncbi:MAG: helix-turn-helix transcriptional regulator [Lachnospiraceae bacterium]|nr:helix-turn-helix transcriptional regulator [Lachnospiraceae bacterium]
MISKLYENIKSFRLMHGWTQDELARRTGYTDRSTIAKIEAGIVDLTQSKIVLFASVFGVTAFELTGWNDEVFSPVSTTPCKDILITKIEKLDCEDRAVVEAIVDGLLSRDKYNKEK